MFRRVLITALVLIGLTLSTTALGGNGYRLYDASWHRPPVGSLYSVNVHGRTPQGTKALVYLYLDSQPCRASWKSEDRLNVSPFKAGQSYFRETGKALITLSVAGQFSISPTAHAGETAQREYACAYLTTPNPNGPYRITVANASNIYYVTG